MIKLLTYLILQSIILSLFASLTYSENRKQNEWKSKISIEWESIERAIGYEVVVKDKKNKIILQQRVEKPSIE